MSTFSHSRLGAFEDCPKKYEFAYVLKVPRASESIETFMGSRVHETLEWLYDRVRACHVPDEEDLVARFDELWDAEWEDSVRVTRAGRVAGDYRAIGEKAVRVYHRHYFPFDQGTTIGLELKVSLRLDETHTLIGVIDRLTKTPDGVWEIHDYKTSNLLMTQDKADSDRQLALYALAVHEMYPDVRRIALVWHYVVFDEEVRSERTLEELEVLRAQVLASVLHVEAQHDFPPRSSSLCDWCEYQEICPAWSHKFALESLDETARPIEDGAALVDEYLRVSEEASSLKDRLDQLRDAISTYADAHSIDRVFGAAGSVKVFRFEQLLLPDTKDPRREELETQLKTMGLWDRFAALSAYTLSRAIQDHAVDADQVAQLEPFITRAPGVKLYPSRR